MDSKTNMKAIKDKSEIGIWVWKKDSGGYASIGGMILNVPGYSTGPKAREAVIEIIKGAEFYNEGPGKPEFMPTHRVDEDEWQQQLYDLETHGVIPDLRLNKRR